MEIFKSKSFTIYKCFTKQNTNNNKNNEYNIHIHMFGEGTGPKNNRRTYFPVTRGSALDNRGHMNSARQ